MLQRQLRPGHTRALPHAHEGRAGTPSRAALVATPSHAPPREAHVTRERESARTCLSPRSLSPADPPDVGGCLAPGGGVATASPASCCCSMSERERECMWPADEAARLCACDSIGSACGGRSAREARAASGTQNSSSCNGRSAQRLRAAPECQREPRARPLLSQARHVLQTIASPWLLMAGGALPTYGTLELELCRACDAADSAEDMVPCRSVVTSSPARSASTKMSVRCHSRMVPCVRTPS